MGVKVRMDLTIKTKAPMTPPLTLLASFVFCLVALIGCARPKPPAPAAPTLPASIQMDADRKQLNARVDHAYQDMQNCKKNLNESAAGKDVAKQILILNSAQNNRYELLKSKAKLSPSQKNILINYLNLNITCNEMLLAGLRGTPMFAVQEKSNLALDNLFKALIAREVTIGDSNLLFYNLTKASDWSFNSSKTIFGLDQMNKVFAAEDAEKAKRIADNKAAGSYSTGNAATLTAICAFSKDPQACTAGVLSGVANQSDGSSRNKNSNFSGSINDDIKRQRLIEETKRQMQNDIDYQNKTLKMGFLT